MNKIINKIKNAFKKKKSKLQLPNIVYSNEMTEERLLNYHIGDNTVAECLDLILYELGFISGEHIIIGNCSDFKWVRGYYIECYQDEEYLFRLGFDYSRSFSRTPRLIVTYPNKNIEMTYEIDYELVKNKLQIALYLVSCKHQYSSGIQFLRNYNWEDAEYIISKGENQFVLKVDKPYDLENTEEYYYRLHNEGELANYLSHLEFPIEIGEVYKKICEISLGNVSDYPFVSLCAISNGLETDTLDIEEGEWQIFKKTKGGKTVVICQNGTWAYKSRNDDASGNKATIFTINYEKNGIRCDIHAKTDSELDNYIDNLASNNVSTAREEVEDTKKLIKQIFNQPNH